ncbi:hypothetical protein D9615_000016 [Tricholomella constricta]|uniref:Uncharacterized protein n=1 Tax=Tricholomella constricta TaxID=117010 RepID=A0A8H5MB99_9AGAR|nr:hypothetical protein D9615_000016 [Tricholomella constricta]
MPRDMTLSMPLDEHINADILNAAGHQSSCKSDKDMGNHDMPSWTALHNNADTSDAESDVDQLTDTTGPFSHPPKHKHTFFHDKRPIGMKHTYERNPFSGSKPGKLVQMELKNLSTRNAPFSTPSSAASGGSQTSGSIRQITGAHSTPPTSSTSARSAFGAKRQVKSVGSVAALRSRFLGVVITTPPLRGRRSIKSSVVSSEATDNTPPSSSVAIFPLDQPRPNTCVDHRRSLGSSITPIPLGAPVIDWQHPLTALQRDCAHVHESPPFPSLPPSLEPTSSLTISSSMGIRLRPSRLQLWRSQDKSFTGTPRRTPFDSNNRDMDASHTNPASSMGREPEAERSTGIEDSPFKAFKFALDQDTLPERHASVPRERASVALALGSSLSSSVARTSARKAGFFERPAIARRRSCARQARIVPQDIPKVLREDEIEEFFGAELGRVYFGKEGAGAVVDADVVKMNLRHLFASMSGRKDDICDQDEDRRIDAVSTRSFGKPSYSRGERFIEALEQSFGAGSEDRGQGRKPNKVQMRKVWTTESNSASKTSPEASVSSNDDIHGLSLGLKRPLDGESEVASHKRARAKKLEANSESNSVNEAMAEEWVATMQRLIKGKVMPDKKSLRGLSDLLRMVNDLRSHVGADVLKATRLSDTVMQLSQLEDVPFGDEHGLRGRARELEKFWEIVLRKP